MVESTRTPISKLMENSSGFIPDRLIQDLPDSFVEYLIIDQRRRALLERAPGKYDTLLDTLHILSNFNLLTKIKPAPGVGNGFKPAVEPAYHLGRWHNDAADNKTPLPFPYQDYPELVRHQKELLEPSDNIVVAKGLTIDFLLSRAITKLEKIQKPNDNVRQDLSLFLDSMLTEYYRRTNKEASSFEELSEIYNISFGRPHNVMLIAIGSSARAQQISLLPQIQGGMYNSELKSLYEDLKLGICYIPKGVLLASDLTLEKLVLNPGLVEMNEVIKEWRLGEIYRCSKMFSTLLANTRRLDWKARFYVKSLTRNMEPIFNNQL